MTAPECSRMLMTMNDIKWYRDGAILLNLIVLLSGIVLILAGIIAGYFDRESVSTVCISVGCSLTSTAIVGFLYVRYQTKHQKMKELMDVWGLKEIYDTRAIMNQSADRAQERAKERVDAIGFGFRSWRQAKTSNVIRMLGSGVRIRILSVLPNTIITKRREIDEEVTVGDISKSIIQLRKWVEELRKYGDIELRFHKSLPLDFYFRIDDTLFIGPYMYKKLSQQTVSYEFSRYGKMFREYAEYFESVWNDAYTVQQVESIEKLRKLFTKEASK